MALVLWLWAWKMRWDQSEGNLGYKTERNMDRESRLVAFWGVDKLWTERHRGNREGLDFESTSRGFNLTTEVWRDPDVEPHFSRVYVVQRSWKVWLKHKQTYQRFLPFWRSWWYLKSLVADQNIWPSHHLLLLQPPESSWSCLWWRNCQQTCTLMNWFSARRVTVSI